MPIVPPLTSSAGRELKRPRPIPKPVYDAMRLMIYGRPSDPDGRPLTFTEVGVKADVMRRYLDRPAVIALLRRERRAYREALCGGNEGALRAIRDASKNDMARVAAVRQLETMNAEEAGGSTGEGSPQSFSINIISRSPDPVTIEGRTIPAPRSAAPYALAEPEPEPPAEPIFQWRRP